MNLYMKTTQISAEKTAQEISSLLIEAGASAIRQDLKDKKICGLSFTLDIDNAQVPFMLPVRTDPVFKQLQKEIAARNRERARETHMQQAERVAWRQLLRWIQAQVAMIDTGMVAPQEVFFPYIQTGVGQTLYQKLTQQGGLSRLALPENSSNPDLPK